MFFVLNLKSLAIYSQERFTILSITLTILWDKGFKGMKALKLTDLLKSLILQSCF